MRRAIALSAFGLGRTSPNPPVGCVILDRAGNIVGEGYHERKGEAHAEVHALAAAGDRARGGTAVVTLEPCNHHGLTPPCHLALLDAGIMRTVIAVIDPTSREEGGAARLGAAGVDVEVGLLADTARLVLRPWLYGLRFRRPHVTWLHEIHQSGWPEAPDDALLAHHRTSVDAVLDDHGHVTEGIPDGHGHVAFSLPKTTSDDEPGNLLAALYTGGVRSLLLAGSAATAEPFLRENLVDHLTTYVTSTDPSVSPTTPASLSPGLRIDGITRYGAYVRIDADFTDATE
ncbi:bifunctional diaminohydroxyphosphoribosylaminopyrimidine deaminase/5-amino-6-(5-phosphoribosylamino)uracil reductase RibD [Actinosynnema sp. NPDC004786]